MENTLFILSPIDTWKTVGQALHRILCNLLSPPLSSFSPYSPSSCSSLLVSIRFKSQILLVLFHHGHITLFRITESLSSYKQLNTCAPSHNKNKLTVLSYHAEWKPSLTESTDILGLQYWYWAKHKGFSASHPLFIRIFFLL